MQKSQDLFRPSADNNENRYLDERNWLAGECAKLAAPLGYTNSGTVESAAYNLREYVHHLEVIAREARDLVGDHCSSHLEHQDSCSTCVIISTLGEVTLT